MIFDANAFIGRWPYWPVAPSSAEDVAQALTGWGILRAAICSTRSLFVHWKDGNCEAEAAAQAHPDRFVAFTCLGTLELSHALPQRGYDFDHYAARGFRGIRLCRIRNLVLIEDCSQACWAEHRGRLVGTMGDIGCFSLQQSKHMICGEGGLIATRHTRYAERARLFGDKAWPRDSGSLGSCSFLFLSQNYRMSEMAGAVALAQLGKVKASVERRRAAAAALTVALRGVAGVCPPAVPSVVTHSWWLYMLRVDQDAASVATRESADALTAEGVPAWVRYTIDPLYLSPVFTTPATYGASGYPLRGNDCQRYERGLCPAAEQALSEVIAIHWNENYTTGHVAQTAAAVRKVAHHFTGKRD